MPALHLMTFNVQLLPWLGDTAEGRSNDAEAHANRVCEDILALADSPDVIAFNEAFDEDGRRVLFERLSPGWPNVIEKVDGGILRDDSGLMLFSRYAFLPMAGGNHAQHIYRDRVGTEKYANKGVAAVMIGTPVAPTIIAFTHLQAFYDYDGEHADIRRKQLDDVADFLEDLVADHAGWRGAAILMGDFNIRGDVPDDIDPAQQARPEWENLFDTPRARIFQWLCDGWNDYMHPPGLLPPQKALDQGRSNIDFEHGNTLRRLDYMCFARPGSADMMISPQRMFLRLRNASDHFALEAIVHRTSPHCTPSDAIDVLSSGLAQVPTAQEPSTLRIVPLTFKYDGSFQWLYVRLPGTFSLWSQEDDVVYDVFALSDLSNPLASLDTLAWDQMPPEASATGQRALPEATGKVFASHQPFLIAVRHKDGQPGESHFGVMEHHGDTRATALFLRLHDFMTAPFPVGEFLGADDMCWFKALPGKTWSATARVESFEITNTTGDSIDVGFAIDPGEPAVLRSGADPLLRVDHETSGGELLLLTLKRSVIQHAGIKVFWFSPVTYLRLDEPLGLLVDDASGPDFLGSDEPEMQIAIDDDTQPIFAGTWDDADSGERWPNLDASIRGRIQERFPGASSVGFFNALTVSYIEPDFAAQGSRVEILYPLARDEEMSIPRKLVLPVPDPVSDGQYTFYCTLSKLPDKPQL